MATLPEPFRSNPFRTLRLGAAASEQQIQEALASARIKARLSGDQEAEHELEGLLQAQSELLNSTQRSRHAESWFFEPPSTLFDTNFLPSQDVLESLVSRPPTLEARRDLANWYLLLAYQARGFENVLTLTSACLENWRLSLFSQHLPDHFVAVLAEAIKERGEDHKFEDVDAYFEALVSAQVSEDVLRELSTPGLEALAQHVRRALTVFHSGIGTVSECRKLAESVQPFRDFLNLVRDYAGFEYFDLVEGACRDLRGASVARHNEHEDTVGAIQILELALELDEGEMHARLQADLQELSEQLRQKRLLSSVQSAVEAFKAKNWAAADNALQDAAMRATTSEERSTIAGLRERIARERSRSKWKPILGWAGGLAALVAVAAAAGGASNEGNATPTPFRARTSTPLPRGSGGSPPISNSLPTVTLSTPVVVRPTATPDTRASDRARLSAQIDANRAQLATWNQQLENYKSSLTNLNTQLDALDSQMSAIVRAHAINSTLSEPYYSQYENLRRQYNNLASTYETTRSQNNSLVAQYNFLLDETNKLIVQYNAR